MGFIPLSLSLQEAKDQFSAFMFRLPLLPMSSAAMVSFFLLSEVGVKPLSAGTLFSFITEEF